MFLLRCSKQLYPVSLYCNNCIHVLRTFSHRPYVKRFSLRPPLLSGLIYQSPRSVAQQASVLSSPRNVLKRAQKFIQDNPFTKFSLALCAIVLGLSVAVELYNRFKKKKIPVVIVYPPKVGHYTVERTNEVVEIGRKLRAFRHSVNCPILYVTGAAGTGKTELVCQFVDYFTETSSKWFGLRSVKPTVLYFNGRNEQVLKISVREAALSLGLKDSDLTLSDSVSSGDVLHDTLSAIHKKFEANKLPWLIVVDDLDRSIIPTLHSALSSIFIQQWRGPRGSVVVTTRSSDAVPKDCEMTIDQRMTVPDSLKLLVKLSGLGDTNQDLTQQQQLGRDLLEQLEFSPLTIALAASTIKAYQSFLQTDRNSSDSPIATYHDILKEALTDSNLITATLSLYLEAASSDPRLRHTFDLLGSCHLENPVPTALISQHLSNVFYGIPEESITPPPSNPMEKIKELTGSFEDTSYFGQVKNMLPFVGKKPPTQAELSSILAAEDDKVSYLRDSPLLSFKAYGKSRFEFLQVHSCAQNELPRLFTTKTAPVMDNNHVSQEEEQFNQTAWFRTYRTFNKTKCLEDYHRSLPGMSAPGVMTNDVYQKHPPSPLSESIIGTKTSDQTELDYYEYQHLVSHYHRVILSMLALLKAAGGDIEDAQLRKYLQPHLEAASRYPLISQADRTMCSYGLVSIDSALSPPNDEIVERYYDVLFKQREVFGSNSEFVARTMTDIADVKYSLNDSNGAKQLLEDSLQIYEKIPTRYASAEFQFDVGLVLSSLAIVYSDLGDKEKCKDLLERALGAYQTMPPDGKVMKRQRKLVSRSLTDVAHAYLALGDLAMAKKYVDLSVLAHQNLYLEAHSETVRTLNVGSIVYAMLGNKAESHRLRMEAGKVTAQLESKPLLM